SGSWPPFAPTPDSSACPTVHSDGGPLRLRPYRLFLEGSVRDPALVRLRFEQFRRNRDTSRRNPVSPSWLNYRCGRRRRRCSAAAATERHGNQPRHSRIEEGLLGISPGDLETSYRRPLEFQQTAVCDVVHATFDECVVLAPCLSAQGVHSFQAKGMKLRAGD